METFDKNGKDKANDNWDRLEREYTLLDKSRYYAIKPSKGSRHVKWKDSERHIISMQITTADLIAKLGRLHDWTKDIVASPSGSLG